MRESVGDMYGSVQPKYRNYPILFFIHLKHIKEVLLLWIEFLKYLISNFNNAVFIVLMCLICTDVIAGLRVAIYQKSNHSLHGGVESSYFIKGIWRKVLNILIYTLGVAFSFYTGQQAVYTFVSCAVIGYEGISVIENFTILGMPFPKKLKELLEVFKEKGGDDK